MQQPPEEPAPSGLGYALLIGTAVALVLSTVVLFVLRRAPIVAFLVGWRWLTAGADREGGLAYFVLHVVPQLFVAGPLLSVVAAIACAGHFVSRRGQLSRRARMVWLLALAGATLGWPFACTCVSLQGMAQSAKPTPK